MREEKPLAIPAHNLDGWIEPPEPEGSKEPAWLWVCLAIAAVVIVACIVIARFF